MNKPAPKIYRKTNWPSYNRALINRGNISISFNPKTEWYAQPQGKQGRNQTYSDTAIQCCLMIKSLFRISIKTVCFILHLNATHTVLFPVINQFLVYSKALKRLDHEE
jgi:hypothetical protein